MQYLRKNPEILALGWQNVMDSLIVDNILNSMSDSLIVFGHEGEVLYANKITKDILGYTLEDFREKGIARLFFESEVNRDFSNALADTILKKSTKEYHELDYHHPDGTMRRLAATTSYLVAHGEHESTVIGFVALFKDITEVFNLKRIEQELLRDRERIARERVVSLHKLAMGVAHEIRNPVVTIGGFAARIMRDEANQEKTRTYAASILEDARRLEKVVDEIHQYCDLSEPSLTQEDVGLIVVEAVNTMASGGGRRNVRVEVHNSVPGHCTLMDPAQIKRAVELLLENAIDFSPRESQVDVFVYVNDEGTVLEVSDSGQGISPRDLEYIFDPFFSTRTHGTGMGLATVQRIVQEHRGTITVDSSPGKGTSVRIVLPMSQP